MLDKIQVISISEKIRLELKQLCSFKFPGPVKFQKTSGDQQGDYLIWKLRSLAKICYPIEVAEVEIAASGGRQSGQGPGEKNSIRNSEICNFWATQTLCTSKESWEQSSFRFEIKLGNLVMKKLKKNLFCNFRSQNIIISARSQRNFWKTCQDSKKMTWLPCTWDLYG